MWFCLHHLHTVMENIYGRDDEVIMTVKDLRPKSNRIELHFYLFCFFQKQFSLKFKLTNWHVQPRV